MPSGGLASVALDEGNIVRWNSVIQQERLTALSDLMESHHFVLRSAPDGPYHLRLAVLDNRLNFELQNLDGVTLAYIPLALSPFRNLIREYLAVCEAFYGLQTSHGRERLEAIDMGRKGLHDDGAALLIERLGSDIEVDHTTARRLFTLMCVLQLRELV
jgi:uncharacterized protein (UPF0262 family)